MSNDIFEIKLPFEKSMREDVIINFSAKQGGKFNVFDSYWQCYAWAAVMGFLYCEPLPLESPIDRIFNLNTMRNNDGEHISNALVCMTIAKAGSVDILKDPNEFINLLAQYANAGFHKILKLIENGENSFNDLEKVKQEIFSRYVEGSILNQNTNIEQEEMDKPESPKEDASDEDTHPQHKKKWTSVQDREIKQYSQMGMTIEQLAQYFQTSNEDINNRLDYLGIKK